MTSRILEIEAGWQSVDAMMTRNFLDYSPRMHGHREPRSPAGSQMIL
jgi:hypothetical protein